MAQTPVDYTLPIPLQGSSLVSNLPTPIVKSEHMTPSPIPVTIQNPETDPALMESLTPPTCQSAVPPAYSHFSNCPQPMQPTSMPMNPNFMAYLLQQMGGMMVAPSGTVGMPLPLHGIQGASNGAIDPQLLPPGDPVFSNPYPPQYSNFPWQQSDHYFQQSVPANQPGRHGAIFASAAPLHKSKVLISQTKTPKRKRSQEQIADDYTPTRSNRKRRPTQKLLDSNEIIQ